MLWLTRNMRLEQNSRNDGQLEKLEEFANWILNMGEGKLGEPDDGEVEIDIPDDLLIKD